MKVWNRLRIVMTLTILSCLPLFVLSNSSAQGKKPTSKEPISQKGLLDALHIGGLSTKALIQQIRTRGVAFELTAQVETELRAAGAKPAVIDAVRTNYRPFVGTLNITSTVAGTSITVAGLGSYVDRIVLKVPPGRYQITGEKLGHRGDVKNVEVKFGEASSVELRPLPMTTEEMLALATERFERNDYGASVALTRSMLTRQPAPTKAVALLAANLYMLGEYDESIIYFSKAISSGESVAISVLQRHGGSWGGKTLSAGRLTFQQNSVEFYSLDFPDESFKIPYAKIVEMSIKDQMRLNLKVKVKLPKNRKETDVEYNLYSPDGVATGTVVTCPECLGKMRVILQILRQFRTGT